jgi:cytochrome c oxidase cbb3-type subunit I/II
MIRPFVDEKLRYGDPSRIEESMWDHPFQWGSKRTGPDLARVGGRYYDSWHFKHMIDPRSMSEGSNMPAFPWLADNKLEPERIVGKIKAMKALGVPYTDEDIATSPQRLCDQAAVFAARIRRELAGDPSLSEAYRQQIEARTDMTEVVALVAYLQRLGRNQRAVQSAAAK